MKYCVILISCFFIFPLYTMKNCVQSLKKLCTDRIAHNDTLLNTLNNNPTLIPQELQTPLVLINHNNQKNIMQFIMQSIPLTYEKINNSRSIVRLQKNILPDGTKAWHDPSSETINIIAPPEHITSLIGHHKPIIAVALSDDGNHIASVSSDETIKLWDKTGACLKTMSIPLERYNDSLDLAFDKTGQFLALSSRPRTSHYWHITLWNIEYGVKKELFDKLSFFTIDFDHNNKLLLQQDNSLYAVDIAPLIDIHNFLSTSIIINQMELLKTIYNKYVHEQKNKTYLRHMLNQQQTIIFKQLPLALRQALSEHVLLHTHKRIHSL